MAEPKTNELMEKIVSLCKRRGFVFQSSEIYGGINGFWDYGPLGAELKRNVKELWWQTMTRQRDDVVGLEATIIMAPQIWRASGHVDTFSDPMCDCLLTKKRFRADQIEPQSGRAYFFFGACDFESFFKLANSINDGTNLNEARNGFEKLSQWLKWGNTQTDVSKERILEPAIPIPSVGTSSVNRSSFAKNASESLNYLASVEAISILRFSDFAVLLPPGKPPEKAFATARQFFQLQGVKDPLLFFVDWEDVKDTVQFNPENGAALTEPRPFNLMFKTYVGPTATEADVAYLRPETAQAIFAQFKNVFETSRQKLPFGICQIGKAFRNEVTPRNFTFRSREFEQMELEFFIKPDEVIEAVCGRVANAAEVSNGNIEHRTSNAEHRISESQLSTLNPQPDWGWEAWHKYWVEERVRFYEGIGLSRETLGFHIQTPEELAHYARATTDILFKFPFSKKDEQGNVVGDELEGIAARSDFDLSQHERFSGKPMGVFDDELRAAWGKLDDAKKKELSDRYYNARLKYLTKSGVEQPKAEKQARENADGLAKGQYIPHVIEPSAGVDRLILALISNAFTEITDTDEKGKSETRVVMKFHPRVAPIKLAVFPLLKNKPELVSKAKEVRDLLRQHMNVFYDDGGSIGRRYARQDEAGTPFCATIDFDTLGEKPELLNTVTVRHRDDGRQERLAISELKEWLLARIR